MSERELVEYFVDGTEVDYQLMLKLGLIEEEDDGEYWLTDKGQSLI